MTDYSKPFPCRECGEMVMANQEHTFEDCKKWKLGLTEIKKKQIQLKRLG